MGLFQDANAIGREIQHKRKEEKIKAEAHEEGKQEKEAEIKQHEENKEQGML